MSRAAASFVSKNKSSMQSGEHSYENPQQPVPFNLSTNILDVHHTAGNRSIGLINKINKAEQARAKKLLYRSFYSAVFLDKDYSYLSLHRNSDK